MESVGSAVVGIQSRAGTDELMLSLKRLFEWVEGKDYRGYDTFDGLNALVRPLTLNSKLLRTVLQQAVRRFPINLRPLLGVREEHSTKGMAFFARGFIRLHQVTGEPLWAEKAKWALEWLISNQSQGYSGACWGNHFDYQSRSFYLPKGMPTVVWTSLIGHAFLDAYSHFDDRKYLQIAESACQHILRDLEHVDERDASCISYIPHSRNLVHNANTLGASLLARVYKINRKESCRELAQKAIRYTANHQLPDGSWYYGQKDNLHWIDNFHTAYVLDCFKYYADATGDPCFEKTLRRGYEYWKRTFFLPDGTPKYYSQKTLPIDIQCCSQAIDTLVFFRDRDSESLDLALKVARWTIANMRDASGYFYYRRYGRRLVNKTATLHWGQATMFSALSALYKALSSERD